MRVPKKQPHNPQAEYYKMLMKLERQKKAFIMRWIKRHHPTVFAELNEAIKADVERRYRLIMWKFDQFLLK